MPGSVYLLIRDYSIITCAEVASSAAVFVFVSVLLFDEVFLQIIWQLYLLWTVLKSSSLSVRQSRTLYDFVSHFKLYYFV